jgi:hypothetical protein
MGGSRYLRKLLDNFNGIMANGAIPGIPETEQYVKKVLREYGRMRTGIIAGQ